MDNNNNQIDIFYDETEKSDFNDITDDISKSITDTDFNDIVIWGTDWTLDTIYQQINKGNIDLNPSFQRRDAWNDITKSLLIESFIIGMPVPPIILAEKKDEKGKYLVIDGKQRLLTICQFFSDGTIFKSLRLNSLNFLKHLDKKFYSNLNDELIAYKNAFDNQTLRTIVIKNWQKEQFLYSIFLRLNTGSKKLSSQELRQALHPGLFLKYLDEATAESTQFKKMLKNDNADQRMLDIELALRSFAFKYYFSDYRGNLKSFLDDSCYKLNNLWNSKETEIRNYFSEIEKAIDFTYDVFNYYAFSKTNTQKYSFNRALYEVFIYYFSIEEVRNAITEKNLQGNILDGFRSLCLNDKRFIDCISSTFSSMKNVKYRFEKTYELIHSLIDIQIPQVKLNNEQGFFIYS